MKNTNSIAYFCALIVLVASAPSWTDDDDYMPLMVSRDSDGSINKESKVAIKRLSRMARQNGHVRVWVTLNTPFDPFLANSTQQDAVDQQQRVDELFDEVLNPLLAVGDLQYASGEREYNGPSLLMVATQKGLNRLVKDRRVGQLVGVPK